MTEPEEEFVSGFCKMQNQTRMVICETLLLENGKKEVLIRMYQCHLPKNKSYYTVEEVGEFLSVFFNKRLVPCMNTPFFLLDVAENYCFEEEAGYSVLTGYSKLTKEGEKVSGDTYLFFESEEKKFYSVLSVNMKLTKVSSLHQFYLL